jgi:16S rRNA processing protein RimM
VDKPVVIAKIGRYRGTRGEVFIHPRFDLAGEPLQDAEARLVWPNGTEETTRIERIWWQGKKAVCKLAISNSIEEARKLVHAEILVRRSDLEMPEADEYFVDDLIGLQVQTVDGKAVGPVAQLLDYAGSKLLKVDAESEILIPFTEAIVDSIDLESGVVIIDPPEGLLEINEV